MCRMEERCDQNWRKGEHLQVIWRPIRTNCKISTAVFNIPEYVQEMLRKFVQGDRASGIKVKTNLQLVCFLWVATIRWTRPEPRDTEEKLLLLL